MKAPSIIANRESCLTDLTATGNACPPASVPTQTVTFDSILDSLDEGVLILDRRGVVLKANPSFCRLFTTSAVGMPASSVVPGSTFREMLDAFLHDFLPEHHSSPAFRIPLEKDIVLSVRITPLKNSDDFFASENAPYAVVVFHNISDLVRLNRRRREFMGEVAHELRTPLTTIIGFAETILDLPPHHTEDRQKFTGIILRNARHMALLVEDMLRLSKLESGTVPLQLTCVRAAFVLEDALDACSPHMEAKELTCDIHIDRAMNIRADAHYITQVFRNLLENACRYAPNGSVITVTGEPSPFESMAVFTVADQGPGIPQGKKSVAFNLVLRADERSLTGQEADEEVAAILQALERDLGKHIVERHGGMIRAEKGPGGMFLFTVPLAQ